MIRISLVVPAFNEEDYLPTLLDSVEAARARYDAGGERVEVIVADNASTDGTALLARTVGCRVVCAEQRSIACSRNAGARVATGEILAFVDADSRIHPETFNAIERTLSPAVVVGATGVEMSRKSPGIRASMFVATALLRVVGVDSGVIFCRRSDWQAVGGYNEQRQFAEDVQFLFDLKRLGRDRGQRFARVKGVRTITSARKFDRFGDWHLFATLARGVFWVLFDRPAFRRFVHEYWYKSR